MTNTFTIEEAVHDIISGLKQHDVIIQRYNSMTTNSVYLKLDYGVANSIRISDHNGKKQYAYRFNLQTDIEEYYKRTRRGYDMHYFPAKDINNMIHFIIQRRAERIHRYGFDRYEQFMHSNKESNKNTKGFWSMAKLV